MSDALTYLVKARPEAMGAYFKFLKGAGAHLDPKTRNLISVITKVHAQTENGLRQYLTRALREGASRRRNSRCAADGLSRARPCQDRLGDRRDPRHGPAGIPAGPAEVAPCWHDVAPLTAVKAGKTSYFDCDGRNLFVFRKGAVLKVYDSRCPHQVTNIPHLALEGKTLTCPKHEWAFDIETGRCIANGDRPLTEFPHKVEKKRLLVFW